MDTIVSSRWFSKQLEKGLLKYLNNLPNQNYDRLLLRSLVNKIEKMSSFTDFIRYQDSPLLSESIYRKPEIVYTKVEESFEDSVQSRFKSLSTA